MMKSSLRTPASVFEVTREGNHLLAIQGEYGRTRPSHIRNMATRHVVHLSPALIQWRAVRQREAYLRLN